MDVYTTKTINKVKRMYDDYKKYLYNTVTELSCENAVIPAPPEDPAERAKFSAAMPQDGWKVIKAGDTWGGDFRYDWFRAQYTVPQELDGKTLLIKPDIGLAEALLFINGKPSGLFDYNPEIKCNSARLHEVQPLAFDAKAGETFEIVLECYAGHELYGTHPEEDREHNDWNFYPYSSTRVFNSIDIVLCDEVVAEFLMQHRIVKQIIDCYEETSTQRMLAVQAFQKLFELLPRYPQEVNYDWHNALQEANAVLKSVTSRKSAESEELGYIGLIGHSHLDTAWQWPVRETLHKAARTFSNALRLMERYPDYHFIQSSVVYIDWMKKYYPDIYEGIKKRTAEGRWEPNGGAWVECDDNIPNGEFMIRQFLYGQRYTKENLNYMADCFWQPDTFGYSAAIPQILKGCGIKYFLTTKLSWNEANQFPHDSFIWKGLDGTEVLTHFNLTHNFPDVVEIQNSIKNTIKHPEISNMKLMSYGYGDGGG
ncbi:MAG: hypothetical protein MJ132_09165, partial [Clostridia bacterium]|nr:hypothetical protein [Clostridia bacterium]